MQCNRLFYKCNTCGNIVGFIDNNGPTPQCCGQDMTLLVPNTVDASQEKHVPDVTRNGLKLDVSIGKVIHPATQEHHIMWIAVAQDRRTQRYELEYTQSPVQSFYVDTAPLTVYAYCNLHGLWALDA